MVLLFSVSSTGVSRGQGGYDPQISSISCHFVLWKAVSQTQYCCSLEVKRFSPPINYGLATPRESSCEVSQVIPSLTLFLPSCVSCCNSNFSFRIDRRTGRYTDQLPFHQSVVLCRKTEIQIPHTHWEFQMNFVFSHFVHGWIWITWTCPCFCIEPGTVNYMISWINLIFQSATCDFRETKPHWTQSVLIERKPLCPNGSSTVITYVCLSALPRCSTCWSPILSASLFPLIFHRTDDGSSVNRNAHVRTSTSFTLTLNLLSGYSALQFFLYQSVCLSVTEICICGTVVSFSEKVVTSVHETTVFSTKCYLIQHLESSSLSLHWICKKIYSKSISFSAFSNKMFHTKNSQCNAQSLLLNGTSQNLNSNCFNKSLRHMRQRRIKRGSSLELSNNSMEMLLHIFV